MLGSRVGKAHFLGGNYHHPPPALNAVSGSALVTQCWSCREESEGPGGEEGEVKRPGGGRIFFLITSFGIMENCCMITPRFHSRVGLTCQELTEVETWARSEIQPLLEEVIPSL